MAEVKITCPNCMNDKHCFEETAMDFKSYMCFNCGFTSNSAYTNESKTLETMKENGFKTIVSDAIKKAIERSKELGK